jgi:hypothetical protein
MKYSELGADIDMKTLAIAHWQSFSSADPALYVKITVAIVVPPIFSECLGLLKSRHLSMQYRRSLIAVCPAHRFVAGRLDQIINNN